MAKDFGRDAEVQVPAYLGQWYEHARTPNDFEDNEPHRDGQDFGACFNSTADYQLVSQDEIRVTNRCTRQAIDGDELYQDIAHGKAKIKHNSNNRRLTVAFGPWIARAIQWLFADRDGNYWIYALGPINDDGQYSWSIVSGPDKDYIFILTRDKDIDSQTQANILEAAQAEGLPVDDLIFRQLP